VFDYETTWYCLRRSSGELFPDGAVAPPKTRNARRPIWILLGGGSWNNAITFGCNRYEVEKAARDFKAKEVVWLEPDNEPEVSKAADAYHRYIHGL
jgi:hypothetical protein